MSRWCSVPWSDLLPVAKPTQQALLDMGRARRCRHCDHLTAADVRVCPVCRGQQPKGKIKTDGEVSTWAMLGGWVSVVLLGFGLLTLIGLGLEWARRATFLATGFSALFFMSV